MRTRARSTPTAGGTTGSGLRGCHAHTSVEQTVGHPHMIFIARPPTCPSKHPHVQSSPCLPSRKCMLSFTHSQLAHSFGRLCTHSLVHLVTFSRAHSPIHPMAHHLTRSLTHSSTACLDRSLTCSPRPAGCCNMSWGACGFNNNNISVYSSDTLDNNNWKVESYDALPRATRKVGQYWQVTASCPPPCHSQG
jgi:hypothetical protein